MHFGDVVRNVREVERDPLAAGIERYVGLEHMEPENLHIKSWGLVAEGTTFTQRFRHGQVLFGKRRAYQRKLAVAEFDGVCSGDILVFQSKDERLLPELLPFIVQSEGFFANALRTSSGSLSPRTRWRDLAAYEFSLPPLDEQRRIADILWAADAHVQSWQVVQEALLVLRAALLQELFEPSSLKVQGKSFRSMRLSKVVTYASDGPFGSKLKTEHYVDKGARVIRLQNIGEGLFDDSDKAYISEPYYQELVRYAVYPGDIIVAGLGDENHPVGRASQIPQFVGPAINKADCFCLRADDSVVEQEYLLHFLNSSYARLQVRQRAQGTTRLRINVANLRTVLVPVQSRETQVETCRLFRSINETYKDAITNLNSVQSLAVSLREHLLNGQE